MDDAILQLIQLSYDYDQGHGLADTSSTFITKGKNRWVNHNLISLFYAAKYLFSLYVYNNVV